jgi:hypothetical protein
MTKSEANEILDRVKNGLWQSDKSIKEALFVTGDLSKDRESLCNDGKQSCYVRSRQIYGERAYERVFGIVQESGARRSTED